MLIHCFSSNDIRQGLWSILYKEAVLISDPSKKRVYRYVQNCVSNCSRRWCPWPIKKKKEFGKCWIYSFLSNGVRKGIIVYSRLDLNVRNIHNDCYGIRPMSKTVQRNSTKTCSKVFQRLASLHHHDYSDSAGSVISYAMMQGSVHRQTFIKWLAYFLSQDNILLKDLDKNVHQARLGLDN